MSIYWILLHIPCHSLHWLPPLTLTMQMVPCYSRQAAASGNTPNSCHIYAIMDMWPFNTAKFASFEAWLLEHLHSPYTSYIFIYSYISFCIDIKKSNYFIALFLHFIIIRQSLPAHKLSLCQVLVTTITLVYIKLLICHFQLQHV